MQDVFCTPDRILFIMVARIVRLRWICQLSVFRMHKESKINKEAVFLQDIQPKK